MPRWASSLQASARKQHKATHCCWNVAAELSRSCGSSNAARLHEYTLHGSWHCWGGGGGALATKGSCGARAYTAPQMESPGCVSHIPLLVIQYAAVPIAFSVLFISGIAVCWALQALTAAPTHKPPALHLPAQALTQSDLLRDAAHPSHALPTCSVAPSAAAACLAGARIPPSRGAPMHRGTYAVPCIQTRRRGQAAAAVTGQAQGALAHTRLGPLPQ